LKFESFAQKTWFIKVLILRPKCSKSHLRVPLFSKKSGGYTSGPPLKGGEEKEGAREGSPPIHIPGYATETYEVEPMFSVFSVKH